MLHSVHCEFDTSRLTPLGGRVLDEAAQTLLDHRNLSVEIEAHADAIGTEVSHLGLGGRRDAAPARFDVDDDRARWRSTPQRRPPHAGGESP
jgi:outer membrane protein OmpA-like peptidoglycan-associated protein